MSTNNSATRTVDSSSFSSMKYYDYDIDYITESDGNRMYLVSKIINKYNKINKTDKRVNDYLRNKATKEFIDLLVEEDDCGNSRNLEKQKKDYKNSQNIDIPGIIQHIDIKNCTDATSGGYLFNEQLLNDCLMSVDRKLAKKIINFIIKCRNIDNDFLEKEIVELKLKVKTLEEKNEQLTNRFVKDLEPNNWKLNIVPGFNKAKQFEIRLIYRKTNSRLLSKDSLISVVGIPNANVMRTSMFPRLLDLLENYSGNRKNKQRSRILVPLERYTNNIPPVLTKEIIDCPLDLIKISPTLLQDIKNLITEIITSLDWKDCHIISYM